jgi:putative sigma-54 modulation protein
VEVKVTSKHMELSDALRDYATQKSGKLVKYFDRIQGIEVVVENDKGGTSVEMIVNADRAARFVARHDGDAYASVDACVDKLERQLHEHKDQFRNRKHLSGEDKHARE